MQNFKKWDICWTEVKYEGLEESKDRPIVVTGVDGEYLTALKCTTHSPRDKFDYELKFWEDSGRNKPTTVRTEKSLKVLKGKIRRKSGRLQIEDILGIKKLINYLDKQNK